MSAGHELCGALGVELRELAEHGLAAYLVIAALELRPAGAARLGAVAEVEPADERVDVKPRAADDNRELPAREDIPHGGVRRLDIARNAPLLVRLGDVYQVVRRGGELVRRRLGRADVHAAVELHGVAGDNLGVQALREQYAQARLARGGRAGDYGDFLRHF